MSLIFSITGSISTGKSTVSKFFRSFGVPILDADQVARDVVVPDSIGLSQVINAFGEQYLQEDGTLNRSKLASLVFSNQNELDKLNHIMAPLIENESTRQLNLLIDSEHELVGFDSALIIESGNADRYRPLVVVSCPFDLQLERLMKRNSLTEALARNIISKQLPSEEKVKYADFVIESTGSLDELKQKLPPSYLQLRLLPAGKIKQIREELANKLDSSNDAVGAQLLRAGFKIIKNKKREDILDETVKETDSIKCLVMSQIFTI